MQTTIQRIQDGTQFAGVAYVEPSAGGLVTFTGISHATTKLAQEYVIYEISLDVQATTANAAALTSATIDLVDTTSGTLKWDGQVTGPGTETLITGGTTGHTGSVVKLDDDGTDGTIFLKGATGVFQDDESITGDDTFDGVANGTLEQVTSPLDTTSSLNYRKSWPEGLPVGFSDDSSQTPFALKVVTTGMAGNGTLIVKWGKRRIKQ